MLLDLSIDERKTIIDYLKAYLGLHGRDLSEDEQGKLRQVIRK